MNHSIISTRYAKALFMVGKEQKCLESLEADMQLLNTTVSENPNFVSLLDNPVVKPRQKVNAMHSLLEKRVHPMTLQFIDLLIKNKREIMLPDVARRYIGLYEEYKGIKHAHITLAVSPDETSKGNLQKQLNALFNADVRMTTEVNTDIMGGFIVRVGDQQYDASLSSGLKRLRTQMSK